MKFNKEDGFIDGHVQWSAPKSEGFAFRHILAKHGFIFNELRKRWVTANEQCMLAAQAEIERVGTRCQVIEESEQESQSPWWV